MSTIAMSDTDQERENWIALVRSFSKQVADWATEQGWQVAWKSLDRTEDVLGSYEVPMLIIQTQRRAVMIEPVARDVLGAAGRIDLYAYPTLFRVMLLRSAENGKWRIRTDSGIFLDRTWNKQTFVRLVDELTEAG
jgi:hypothetical protein